MRVPVGFVTLVIATAGTAHAGFPQATCPSFGATGARIPANFGATEFDKQPRMSALGTLDDFKFYQNSVNPFATEVLTNSNVSLVVPQFGFFVTEPNYDYLEVIDAAGAYRYTGPINADASGTEVGQNRNWVPRAGVGNGAQSFSLRWNADISVAEWIPPRITGVKPSCKPQQTTTATNSKIISLNTRYDGILLSTNDVIYVQVVQPANTPLIISMDGKGVGTGDLDLFVSTFDPTPDYASSTQISQSGQSSEALEIAAAPFARPIYIGVLAFAGSGHFSLNVMAQAQNDRHALNVCPIGFTPTASERDTITTMLKRGAAMMLAGSNGNLRIKQFTIFTQQFSCGESCDVCLGNTDVGGSHGHTQWNHSCGVVELGRGFWTNTVLSGRGLFHEFGHSCYGLLDEYTGPPSGEATVALCGHSVMNNNKTSMFCSNHHCLDGHSYESGICNPNQNSDWAAIDQRIAYGAHYGNATSATPNDYSANQQLLNLISVF